MKKAIISAALVAAIGAGGYMGFRANNSQSDQLSDVMLANIEAIAESEISKECGGCSTSYNGKYCCTIEVNTGASTISYVLYHPKN